MILLIAMLHMLLVQMMLQIQLRNQILKVQYMACLFLMLKKVNQYYLLKEVYRRDTCLLYTSPSPRDVEESRMPSSA